MKSYKVYVLDGRTIPMNAATYYHEVDQYVFDRDGAVVQFVRESEVVAITFEEMPCIAQISGCATITFAWSGTLSPVQN